MRPAFTPVYPRIKAAGIFCEWSKSFSKITCLIPLLLLGSASDLLSTWERQSPDWRLASGDWRFRADPRNFKVFNAAAHEPRYALWQAFPGGRCECRKQRSSFRHFRARGAVIAHLGS